MTKPIARDPIDCKRAFDAEIIELCVRWYTTYRYLSNVIEQDHRALKKNGKRRAPRDFTTVSADAPEPADCNQRRNLRSRSGFT
jgi:transposase-like protein